jgi:hypothetical protein
MSRLISASWMLTCALLPLSVAAVHAQETFFTTGTYTIDAAHSVNGDAFVGEDSSFSKTDGMGNPYNPTVNLVTGGSVGSDLRAYNSSTVNMSGGSIAGGLFANNSSMVTVSGGSIAASLIANSSSKVTVSGGSSANIITNGNSMVIVSGGSFVENLEANSSSTVTISGGTFGQIFGVNFFDLTSGSFTLVGNNLMAANAGADSFFGGTDYDLSGTLQNGTNLAGYVLNVKTGSTFTLQQAAVPEPGSLALLAGLGLSGAALLRRRRTR